MAEPLIREVSIAELRLIFNAKLDSESLRMVLQDESHPAPPRALEPFCTRSQIVAYFDTKGTKVAIAHRYYRTDGTIGASGRPDPKWVRSGEVMYVIKRGA